MAAGCGTAGNACSFAYRGPGTGTSPLPTYLAYFCRIPAARANDAASYTAVTQFTNSAWTGHLGEYEPDPVDAGNDLHANATFRANALAAGLPANFFVLNPDVDQANITRDAASTKYDALQIDFRRRLSRGLTASVNYTYAKTYETDLDTTAARPRGDPRRRRRAARVQDDVVLRDAGRPRQAVRHEHEPVAERPRRQLGVLGHRPRPGPRLPHRRCVATRRHDRRRAAEGVPGREGPRRGGTIVVCSLPQDIIDNTRRACNTDPTSATGYSADGVPTGRYIAPASAPGCVAVYQSDCGTPHNIYVRGPVFTRFDFSFKKRFPFGRRASFDLQLDLLNALDNINFNPTFDVTPAANTTAFQITSGYTDINTTFDPGGRIGQIVWRLNW